MEVEWSGRGHLEQNQIGLKRKVGICLKEKVRKTRVVAVVEWEAMVVEWEGQELVQNQI